MKTKGEKFGQKGEKFGQNHQAYPQIAGSRLIIQNSFYIKEIAKGEKFGQKIAWPFDGKIFRKA